MYSALFVCGRIYLRAHHGLQDLVRVWKGWSQSLFGDGAERTIGWWPSWCHFYLDSILISWIVILIFEWQAGRQASSTYLLHGQEQRPQNFPRSFKFFSASFMSLLIWSIPSSMRSSCSDYQHIVIFPSKRTKAHEKRREEEEVAGWRGGRGSREGKQRRRDKKDIDCDKRDIRHHHHHQHWTGKSLGLLAGTYFLIHGHIRPQHCPISFKSFSASFRSAFTLFMPSSTRSSCSGEDKGMRAMK